MKNSPQPLAFELYGSQIIGARPVQEDSFGMAPNGDPASSLSGFIVLADGVGGEADGELASRQVVDAALSALGNSPKNMGDVVRATNDSLAAAKKAAQMHPDACSTLIAASYGEGCISWASVGDSLLILRDVRGDLRCLNKRHIQGEYLKSQFARNLITEEQYRSVPKQELEAIYSCISGEALEFVDLGDYSLSPGDRILIASDGILSLGMEGISQMLDRYRDASPQETVQAMLRRVQQLNDPRQDNTTLVILDYGKAGDTSASPAPAREEPPTVISLRRDTPAQPPRGGRPVAAASVIGDSSQQEDSICHFSNGIATLAVVADGAGGHRGGALASQVAVRCATQLWESVLSHGLPADQAQEVLRQFLLDANEAVKKDAVAPGAYDNGRSAIALLYVHAGFACVANAGDCRVYARHADGAWQQLSQDDSVLALGLRMGDIAEEDAWQHPDQSRLTQALGIAHALKPHVKVFPADPQDMFLVCCDGFWNQLRPEHWKHVPLESVDISSLPNQWAESSVLAAAGKSDNVSLILVGPGKQGRQPTPRSPLKWLVPGGGAALLALIGATFVLLTNPTSPSPSPGAGEGVAVQPSTPGVPETPQNAKPHPEEPAPATQPPSPEELASLNSQLVIAAAKGKNQALRSLLDCGADVNAKDISGDTPLHLATFHGYTQTAKLLLERGADINAKNNEGKTPLTVAEEEGKTETADFLRSRGARK